MVAWEAGSGAFPSAGCWLRHLRCRLPGIQPCLCPWPCLCSLTLMVLSTKPSWFFVSSHGGKVSPALGSKGRAGIQVSSGIHFSEGGGVLCPPLQGTQDSVKA